MKVIKMIVSVMVGVVLVGVIVSDVEAAGSVDSCKQEMGKQINVIVGIHEDDSRVDKGYLVDLEDMLSTSAATYRLLPEVKERMRLLRAEFDEFCSAVVLGDQMSRFQKLAFGFDKCYDRFTDTNAQSFLLKDCELKTEIAYLRVLEMVEVRLLQDAVAGSASHIVERYRSLNSKLKDLLNQYTRLIDNFFVFLLRLGDTNTGGSD